MTHPEDYALSANQLNGKYSPKNDGGHPGYTKNHWREAVENRYTLDGYWEWVYSMLVDEQDDHSVRQPERRFAMLKRDDGSWLINLED
jgi:hypothetical protein